ncbi:bacteriocin-type transport-associated protein [Scytonema hofmannii PCC 7110]|uniref:Bacteriocin-type transport-associated protein n=1 Tax=Scytonema hofmannii PCC 7110 TaxID=128403 RepID=A0A139WYX6_9CYAN|nr:cyclic nucleotide-binding domain-containing protein [Scytonema hofmannii]KYC37620.1 bacteriocin-type transport-associated protein [Scytonema hofmannii PCC 7110]
MTEVLLQQLSNSDISWMTANGRQQRIAAGSVLIQQQSSLDTFYLILEGTLSASISRNQESTLASVFAALEDDNDLEQEIARFSSGEVLGEISFLNFSPSTTTVKAVENSVVLALPSQHLLTALRQDLEFATRFYRALAILLLDRFERLVSKFTRRQNIKIPPLQDVPLLFGELSDSDIDWMIEHSHVETLPADSVLIRAGRAVEYLYVLLHGKVSVFFSGNTQNSLSRVFTLLEDNGQSDSSLAQEIASVSSGEIIGETALIDARLPAYTFKAVENSQVLAVKKQQIAIKLQQNPAMGSRLYRVIAMLLAARLQGLISRLGYGRSPYQVGRRLSQDVKYEDEIDLNMMDNLFLGGTRFDWMLKRLKVTSDQ